MFVELQKVDLSYGGPMLLENANLVVERGARVCVLGRNGCGKSSLLSLLAGSMECDEGVRRMADGIKIGWLSQEASKELSGPALEVALGNCAETNRDSAFRTATRKMLDRLGVPPDKEYRTLSGGLRRRTLLSRAIAAQPDLILLDEPTNHLDPDAIIWLERWLQKPGLSVVFISHDRRFIENVATEIVELDRGSLYHARSGYKKYLEQRESRLETEARAQAQFEKVLGQEESWIRSGIKARRTRNQGRVRRLKDMRERQSTRRREVGLAKASVNSAAPSGRVVLELDDIAFAYGNHAVINSFSTRILRGDRIGIIGANGTGKTTLIDLMLGKLEPDSGTVTQGSRIEIAEFDQHRSHLNEQLSALDNVAQGREYITTPGGEKHIIGYMSDFLFAPDQARGPINRFSGGERARLMLARLFSRQFNLLIMDEPTNDLDIETLELLEEMLADFDGTLLLVSHDRAFLENITTSIIHLDGNGNACEYAGGYDEFQRVRNTLESSKPQTNSGFQRSSKQKPENTRRKLSYMLQRELDELPALIETLETDIETIHTEMAAPDFYTRNAGQLSTTNELLERKEQALADAFNRWEKLEGF